MTSTHRFTLCDKKDLHNPGTRQVLRDMNDSWELSPDENLWPKLNTAAESTLSSTLLRTYSRKDKKKTPTTSQISQNKSPAISRPKDCRNVNSIFKKKLALNSDLQIVLTDIKDTVKKKCVPIGKDDDDEVEIISCEEKAVEFFRVDLSWQHKKCKEFKVPFVKEVEKPVQSCVPAGRPTRLFRIGADGNCWFRCISYVLTGSEDHHILIRQMIVSFMETSPVREAVIRYINNEEYFKHYDMSDEGTWATDTEIHATAAWLDTNIYIYTAGTALFSKPKWQIFYKNVLNRTNKNVALPVPEMSVYLNNSTGVHYDVVLDVKRSLV